jgi:hypothetical protein
METKNKDVQDFLYQGFKLEKEIQEKCGVTGAICYKDFISCDISENTNIVVNHNFLNKGVIYNISHIGTSRFVLLSPEEMEKIVKLYTFLKKRYPNKKRIDNTKIIKVDFNGKSGLIKKGY